MSNNLIVQKPWNYCNVLLHDGMRHGNDPGI